MAEKPSMDRLTGQLHHLPFIIGQMGLSIANAQKAFNVDYVENVKKILSLIDETVGQADAENESLEQKLAVVKQLIETLAPSRYQFTEATIDFSADLAETLDVGAQAGLGFGTAAITVNAALTLGYGYDYRAAARITAKLHAIPASPETAKALIARAKEIDAEKLAIPERSTVDQDIHKGVADIMKALTAAGAGGGGGN